MPEDDDLDDLIDALVEDGILIEYVAEDGEKFYQVSPKAEKYVPDLWEEHVKDMKKTLYRLFMEDMVTIEFSEEGPLHDRVSLTDSAYDPIKVANLNVFDQMYLKALIKTFDEHNTD